MSKNKKSNEPLEESIETPVEEPIEETTETPVEEPTEETTETPVVEPETRKTIKGIVTGCSKLKVRKQPNVEAATVCVIEASAEVIIDEEGSTDYFYKVHTEVGVEGFCMKNYITLK